MHLQDIFFQNHPPPPPPPPLRSQMVGPLGPKRRLTAYSFNILWRARRQAYCLEPRGILHLIKDAVPCLLAVIDVHFNELSFNFLIGDLFFLERLLINNNTDRWSDRNGLLLTQEVRNGMCEFNFNLTPTSHSSPWRLHFHSDFGPLARALKSGLRPVVFVITAPVLIRVNTIRGPILKKDNFFALFSTHRDFTP